MARKRGVKAFQLDIDKEDFPFEDNYFDAIFAGEVIEHLYDPDHFLDEVYRTLKGGGLCVITTPNLAAWYNRIVLIFGFQPFWTDASLRYPNIGKMRKIGTAKGEHIRVFTYRALIELLKLYNFKVEKVMGSCHLNPEELFPFPLNFIEKIMCHFKASSDLIVLFKKPQNTNLEHEKLRKEKFK